jgi:plasmid maintenance system antidote protein VapI
MAQTVHIGEIIKQKVTESNKSVVDVANYLGLHRNNIYDIYKRESIDSGLLIKLSTYLKHDFFKYFSKALALEPTPEAIQTLAAYKQLVDELRGRIADKDALIQALQSK